MDSEISMEEYRQLARDVDIRKMGRITVILGEEEFRGWMVAANMDKIDDSSWLAPETYTIKAD